MTDPKRKQHAKKMLYYSVYLVYIAIYRNIASFISTLSEKFILTISVALTLP